MITAHVRGQFACLTTTFGLPNKPSAEVPDSDAGHNEAVEPEEDGMAPFNEMDEVLPAKKNARLTGESRSDELDEVQPAKKKARLVVEEEELPAVVEAKAAAQGHLTGVDQVFMNQATFQDWSKTTQCVTPGRPLAINYYQNISYF
jgi:hypothetical protein